MRLKSVSLVAAAAALGVAPIAAQAASSTRDLAPIAGASELGGDSEGGTQLVFLAVVAAVIAGAVLLTEDDEPLSP